MLIQFAGCQYSDPRVFVENASEWFHTQLTEHRLNICDKFLESKFCFNGVQLTLQAPLQPFFFPEEAYDTFLNPQSIKVYIFPNNELLSEMAIDNHRKYLESLNKININKEPFYVFNRWHKDCVETSFSSFSIFEEILDISIDLETNLGRRFDEDQKTPFIRLLNLLTKNNPDIEY